MKILGITGGVGAGKSSVLNYLQTEYHAVICQLDEVAKLLQQSGQSCFVKIVEVFGEEIVGEDGELDRKKLGEIVFKDAEKPILNNYLASKIRNVTSREFYESHDGGLKVTDEQINKIDDILLKLKCAANYEE